ncbi:MAG: NAD-dependent epimerase/dehydratase family protein [bacterium]|nr:NAD-dependent epimerase/dehydratase family protein [bacterium]
MSRGGAVRRVLVTGGAGFIGSALCEALVGGGHEVTAYDNLLLGRRAFLAPLEGNPRFAFVEADLLDAPRLARALDGHDLVFHMAANSDIERGTRQTDLDLRLGTLATYNVLESMRTVGVREIVFASTSAVYGDRPAVVPTPETYGPLFPISFYGASKLACEALMSAFAHACSMRCWIFRFGNVIGRNGTHGAAFDFIRRLREDPRLLRVLGDGRQAKPYLHVSDCVEGMLFGHARAGEEINCFNLTTDGATAVRAIAEAVVRETGCRGARIEYAGGERGWPGDVPQVRLDGSRLAALGWRPRLGSDEAVARGVRELVAQYFGANGEGA